MTKTETQTKTKVIKKKAVANVLKEKAKVVKISKPVKTDAKKTEIKEAKIAAPRTMRNRTGLHIINPRKVKSTEKSSAIKVSVIGVDGKAMGNMTLPEDVFGTKPNKTLIAQAVRVYLANQRQGNASTKTRSDVKGSTRKIYRQKGTGRARHGAVKAPIFVGGGIAFGPHPHDFSLKFPSKMKKAALISALSEKAQSGVIKVIDGEFSGKTKEVAKLLQILEVGKKGKAEKVLFIVDKNDNATRGAHNIDGLEIERADTVTTYGVVVNKNIIFLKNAVDELTKRLTK
ncbi:MAG: 50S ribosomal protein L4 [Candidatus Levybacteria bacterium]|nr:50S ribosomal protein L4 [Candidatus Levybacteria bacterium]